MIDVEAIRRLLSGVDPQRDPYTVARCAAALLAADSNDRAAAAHYARSLEVLKLFAAAGTLGVATAANMPEGRSGLVPWASRARRFAANLQALKERDPEGAAAVNAAAAGLSRYQLHQACDNNFEILDTSQPIGNAWVGGLANHKAAAALWQFDAAETPVPAPIVFDGLGFGWLFLDVLKTTERSYVDYSCAVYIVEGDPLAMAMVLHMHDLREAIGHPRTRWFVRENGGTALAAFRLALGGDLQWSIPERFIRCKMRGGSSQPPLAIDEATETLARERTRRRELALAQAKAFYAGKDAAYWAERFHEALGGRGSAGGEKLRVLGLTSRYTTVLQHSMAEMQAVLHGQFGDACEMRIAMEPDDHSLENPFIEMIADYKPDLIFQISRLRYENPQIPHEVPFVCWDQDSHPCMRSPEARASLDSLTYIAGHGATFGFTSMDWPRENCIFCHPAGATFRYHDGPAAAELLERHACDISYVSNASSPPAALAAQIRGRWQAYPAWLKVFDRAAGAVHAESARGQTWEYISLKNLVERTARELSVVLDQGPWREMSMELNMYADRCFRHGTLAWAARWCKSNGKTLRLYGRGWESHAQFAEFAAGIAAPGEEARAIYQATRINLQIIEPGFIHSRALDGLAAGGFFLTRRTLTDALDSAGARTLYELACWCRENQIGSDEELEAVDDPRVQEMIRGAKAYLLSYGVTVPIWRTLQVWAEAPAAAMFFPQLAAITFQDEESFGRLAGQYLADDALRRRIAGEMRRRVCEQFSYAARWRTFLRAVQQGLNAAARQPATAEA